MIKNRKGFTTVELVIVIAVIAILATALIPTFGGLIESANKTSRDQEAKNIYNDFLNENPVAHSDLSYYIIVDGNYYLVRNGGLNLTGKSIDDETYATSADFVAADIDGLDTEFGLEIVDGDLTIVGTQPCDSSADCDICNP